LPRTEFPRFAPAWRIVVGSLLLALVGACVTFPYEARVLTADRSGQLLARDLPCAADGAPGAGTQALDGGTLRVLAWNLHKNDDPGWDTDLARFAAESDLLLIQEAALTPELRHVVENAGYRWLLATALRWNGRETGVMTAARVEPVRACTLRSQEPLLQVPKTAIIAYYPVGGRRDTLAVVNIHAINFTLDLESYRRQLEAIARELMQHDGPVIFAGDLNTWTAARAAVVREVAARLGLIPVVPVDDARTRFFGQQVDHFYVRGLEAVAASTPVVRSSDHNPVRVTLRLTDRR
jgi:endonuclease/exonuclease/phosphatase (EEP) superfamily protein YafD